MACASLTPEASWPVEEFVSVGSWAHGAVVKRHVCRTAPCEKTPCGGRRFV